MQNITGIMGRYLSDINLPSMNIIDIIEIILISFFVYQFMVWIKFTRAYTCSKDFWSLRFSCDRLYLQDEYDPLDRVQAGGGADYGNRGYFPAGTPQGCGAAWTEEDHGFYYSV